MLFLSGRQKHLERLLKFDMGRPWTRYWDVILEFEPDDNGVKSASIELNEKTSLAQTVSYIFAWVAG